MGIFKKQKTSRWHPLPEERFPEAVSFQYLKQILGRSSDFTAKSIYIGGNPELQATLCYIDGVVSSESVARDVLRPATQPERFADISDLRSAAELILHGGVFNFNVQQRRRMDDVVGSEEHTSELQSHA